MSGKRWSQGKMLSLQENDPETQNGTQKPPLPDCNTVPFLKGFKK